MLWLAVFCAFCAPPLIGLIVVIAQRPRESSTAIRRGFDVIVPVVVEEDSFREGK
jgi:hypothetical protein